MNNISHAAMPPSQHSSVAADFSPGNRRRLSGPGLRAFHAIANDWELREKQRLLLLGLPSRSAYHGWLRAAAAGADITLPLDTLLRISGVLGIHKALRILFQTAAEGRAWLRGPHEGVVFAGRAPLSVLIDGTPDGILTVRRFLDAARGGLYMAPNAADWDFAPYTDQDVVFA